MRPRSGVTLTEVLVAIFVCGLGLMALMTLFPLGAMNMAQAVKDDRCGHCAANAAAVLRAVWRVSLQSDAMEQDGNLQAMKASLATGPVYIDPLGVNMYGPKPVAGFIPRFDLGQTTFTQALNWCSMLDDLNFNPNAVPVSNPVTGGVNSEVQRAGHYSWAWMVRWLRPADPNPRARGLEFAVVVYKGRPQTQSAGLVPIGENALMATFDTSNPTNNKVSLQGQPPVKVGDWIMDASTDAITNQRHCWFYRITSKNADGSLGVQTPFRGFPIGQYPGQVVIMDNVAEVFERNTLE